MPDTYDHITLMCRLKAAQRRNKELESGERYIQLEELHQKEYNVYEHKIEKLKKERDEAVTALAERDATVSEMGAALSKKDAEIAVLQAQLAALKK